MSRHAGHIAKGCLLTIAIAFLCPGCSRDKGESTAARLERSRQVTQENLTRCDPAEPMGLVYQRVLNSLSVANEETLRKPTLAATLVARRDPWQPTGTVFIWWVEDHPSVTSIGIACGDRTGPVREIPDEIRHLNDADAKGIVIFKAICALEQDVEMKEFIYSCADRNALRVFLMKDGHVVSEDASIIWSANVKSVEASDW